MRSALLVIATLFVATSMLGQRALTPLNFQQRYLIEEQDRLAQENVVTAFAPYLQTIDKLDDALDADTKGWQRRERETWIGRKLRNEHLFQIREGDFVLNGNAAFNLEGARQFDDQGRRRFTNTRGFEFEGAIGERFFFATSFYENQSIFPNYLDSVVASRGGFNDPLDPERGSVPGFGRWKPFNTSDSYDYDYTLGTGYIGYALGEHAFLQFGHDRQFVGYGYRSMLLSDGASPYPFLRSHFSLFKNRITYSTTWAVLQGLERVSPVNYNNKEALFKRLGARFSYLHFQPDHRFGIGLFDATTWQWRNNSHPASIEYYMPHGLVYFGDGIMNHITGLNGFIRPVQYWDIYGQFALNRSTGGQAYQIGMKWQGLPQNLTITIEVNSNDQAAYHNDPLNPSAIYQEPFLLDPNFEHYYQHNDQGLAHPFLVQMVESVMRIDYRWRDIFMQASWHRFTQSRTLNPDPVDWVNTELGYVINPRSNAQIVFGHIQRQQLNNTTGLNQPQTDQYTYFAFRTSLFNRYLAF
jgi:hypothetical protein